MQSFLLVPLRVDGLFAVEEKKSTEAMVDFVRLPYFNGLRDVNYNTANISEEILSQPFQNQNFDLKAGIHLHWAMPDALSYGENVQDPVTGEIKTVFAAVPNRWLITRIQRLEADSIRSVEAEWIVESDYLYPDGEGFQSGSISYPVTPDPAKKEYRPFRFMGRKVPLNLWEPDNPKAEYLDHLTAVGYGQPAFAAFYPNCHSVFGFHDDGMFPRDKQGNPIITGHGGPDSYLHHLSYEIFGWYSDEGKDTYRQTAEAILARLKQQKVAVEKVPDAFQTALEEEFRWRFEATGNGIIPSRMLCYSRIDFHPLEEVRSSQQPVRVAVGNSGSEALAANSAIPITAVSWSGSESWKMADPSAEMPGNRSINIGSMAITDSAIESQVAITVTYDNVILDGGAEKENPFKITPITKNAPAGLWGTDLTPDLNSDAQISGVVTGFTIEPAKPPVPGHTRDIERKNLQFETSQSEKLLRYAAEFSLTAQELPDARNQIGSMVNTAATVQQRSSLLQQWNFREDRDVRLNPDYVKNMMGNPRVITDL